MEISQTRVLSWSLAVVWLAVVAPSVAGAATLRVGPGGEYATLRDALAAAADGDVIEIEAGTYPGDGGRVNANNLTIRGVGELAHLAAEGTPITDRKGILVVNGVGVTLENLELSGAAISASDGCNGAGVRLQSADLTVRGCYFHDNENGILGSPATAGVGEVWIEDSEFEANGSTNSGSRCRGYSHGIYLNRFARVTVTGSYFHRANYGHEFKSRALENFIFYSRFSNETGNGSRELELTEGGLGVVVGNVFQQGSGGNGQMLMFGPEGQAAPHELYVVNNTFVNERHRATFVQIEDAEATGAIVNNLFIGGGTVRSGGARFVEESNLETDSPGVVDRAQLNVALTAASAAIDQGVDPGSGAGQPLTPTRVYVYPTGTAERPAVGALDVGAYEFGMGPARDAGVPRDGGAAQGDAGVAPGSDAGASAQRDAAAPRPRDGGRPATVDAGADGRDPETSGDMVSGSCSASGSRAPFLAFGAALIALLFRRRRSLG